MDRQLYLSLESRADVIRRRLHRSIDAMSDDAIIRLEQEPSAVLVNLCPPPLPGQGAAENPPTLRLHQRSA